MMHFAKLLLQPNGISLASYTCALTPCKRQQHSTAAADQKHILGSSLGSTSHEGQAVVSKASHQSVYVWSPNENLDIFISL